MTLYMPLFRSCNTLRTLIQLHAYLFMSGLHRNTLGSTKLIESYAQMGSLQSSRLVFETFPTPDSFMWGVLIKCYMWNHFFQETILLYDRMMHEQVHVSNFIFPSVLRACSGFGDLGTGAKIHGRIIKCGFDGDDVIETSLLSMYGEIGCIRDARKVFDTMPIRDVVLWSSIISSYADNGEATEGLEMFRRMVFEGVEPDSVIMLSVAQASGELGSLRLARSVHGHIVRRTITSDGSLNNALIVMYSRCGDLCSAESLFVNVSNRSTTSWTAMLSCYNRSGCFRKALRVFVEMLSSNVKPNTVTMMGVIGSCTGLGLLRQGRSVHCYVIRTLMDPENDTLGPALIELYAECGKLSCSEKILHTVGVRNIVAWNMLISLYVQKGLLEEALILFVHMLSRGQVPDSYSLASSLSACGNVGSLLLGCQIHGLVIKRSLRDEFVHNSLIDMYSKCGFIKSAFLIFDRIQHRSVITWNSMICGFSRDGHSVEAISLFDQMYLNGFEMDDVTLLSVIQGCSNLGYLGKGKWVHHKLITYGVGKDLYIETALTDMYSKCGDLHSAQGVFNSMSDRSVVSWSAMIAGYGMHGQINAAFSLFTRMVESGIRPSEVTFMNILCACSHAGSIKEGVFYFNLMREFDIQPNSEHCACMLDILSRAGDLDCAYRLIKSMPFSPHASIWGSLLNGCRIHHRMDMIKIIDRDLLDVSTDDTGYYTLLSNIYAEEGNWIEFRKARSVMKDIGLQKVPGYSTVELDKTVHRFGAGDTCHSLPEEMYRFLENQQNLAQEPWYNV
ncbi:PPR domain-containing protein/PPR_2 domain-containing protein [Cephalotus follicularis]|uniref:PPR domain-containing protein/PPR_2 domain-containing protein n=1 Tax=Cephalotus follicularis TaxID=3775 RepID=A0A1Q3C2Q7_CEPFO|nr:PPR domain-containing protein/PPR_2 domain-containing protein [Cephalotus follicularis]